MSQGHSSQFQPLYSRSEGVKQDLRIFFLKRINVFLVGFGPKPNYPGAFWANSDNLDISNFEFVNHFAAKDERDSSLLKWPQNQKY